MAVQEGTGRSPGALRRPHKAGPRRPITARAPPPSWPARAPPSLSFGGKSEAPRARARGGRGEQRACAARAGGPASSRARPERMRAARPGQDFGAALRSRRKPPGKSRERRRAGGRCSSPRVASAAPAAPGPRSLLPSLLPSLLSFLPVFPSAAAMSRYLRPPNTSLFVRNVADDTR